MTNKNFLSKVSKMQREFAELYDKTELVSVCPTGVQVLSGLFNQFEKENLLEHITKELDKKTNSWRLSGMSLDGVRIFASKYAEKK